MVTKYCTHFCDICEVSKLKKEHIGVCDDYILPDVEFFNWENFVKECIKRNVTEDHEHVCDLLYPLPEDKNFDAIIFIELKTKDWFDEYKYISSKDTSDENKEERRQERINKIRAKLENKIKDSVRRYKKNNGNYLGKPLSYVVVFSKVHSADWPKDRIDLTESVIKDYVRNNIFCKNFIDVDEMKVTFAIESCSNFEKIMISKIFSNPIP